MIVLTNEFRRRIRGKARVGFIAAYRLPRWIQAKLSGSGRLRAFRALTAFCKTAELLARGAAVFNSLKYWTGLHKTEMKANEWLVVIIGVAAGALILHLSPSSTPIAANLVPLPQPTPISSTPDTRTGQEWDCLIVEDSLDLVNLVCEKGTEEAPHLVQVESVNNAP